MKKNTWLPFLLLAGLMSCASSSGYVYYVIDPENEKLLAEKAKDDLPLIETCAPDAQNKAKCIGMLREEYFKMEKELLEARQALKNCQQP